MNNKVAIITVNYRTPWHIRHYLTSVFKYTENFHLFLVQNNPDQQSKKIAAQFEQKYPDQLTVITNDTNLGYVGGVNSAYQQALEYEYVCFVNSDIIVTKDWLKNLQQPLVEDKGISQISCDFSHYYPETRMMKLAKFISRYISKYWGRELVYQLLVRFRPVKSTENAERESFRVDNNFYNFCSGACNLTRTEYFKDLGYFLDPNLVHGYGDDFDLTFYLRQFGKIGVTEKTFLLHFVNASLNVNPAREELKRKVMFLNRLYIVHKWRERISAEFAKLKPQAFAELQDQQEIQIMQTYFGLSAQVPNFTQYINSIPANEYKEEFLG